MDFISKWLFTVKKYLPAKGGPRVLGLDIGTSAIKIVQLRKEKERGILETYGEVAVGPYGNAEIGQAVNLSNDKTVEAIKDVLKESNVKTKRTAVAVPLKSSFITVIQVPSLAGKDIAEMINIEARRYIPVPISEVLLDWWVFPEGETDGKDDRKFVKVLLVVVHKGTINEYKKVISEAGLELESFEIESFSMLRACLGRESEPVAVIDMGASSTKIAIADLGTMKTSYVINRGSQDLTLALSHSLGVDFRRAEEIKRETGLSDLPEHKEIVSVIEPILEYIFSEAKSIISDYQKKNNQSVSRIIITGGGALLKGLIDFAVKRLGTEVTAADPFSKTEYPAFLENVLRNSGLSFSIALGLALKGLR